MIEIVYFLSLSLSLSLSLNHLSPPPGPTLFKKERFFITTSQIMFVISLLMPDYQTAVSNRGKWSGRRLYNNTPPPPQTHTNLPPKTSFGATYCYLCNHFLHFHFMINVLFVIALIGRSRVSDYEQ
jgi:hypothetical protein